MRRRPGFTLIELMIVTVIIAVLATIAINMYDRVQQKAMNTAASTELRNAMKGIDQYVTINGVYPTTLDQIIDADLMGRTDDVDFCSFEYQNDSPPYIIMVAAHVGSTTRMEARYPLWGNVVQERIGEGNCQ